METKQPAKDIVLFVDDEANILNSLSRGLHSWAKEKAVEILTAPSAREGLKIIEADPDRVAVVVSDLKMPEMLGSDFLLEIRASWPTIVTILLTGFSETEEIVKAVKAGIFSFILKPWEPDYLQSELTKALDTRRMKRQNDGYAKTIEEELRFAGQMQRAILKPKPMNSPGVEFRMSYRPVSGLYCGGDYYDIVNIGSNRYLILVGDVSGHGVTAAFVTGILKAIIYPEYVAANMGPRFSPAAFLSWLNERIHFEFKQLSSILISFFAGVLDRHAMTFTYANAGQEHPFVVSYGQPKELLVSGSGLGFTDRVMYSEHTENLIVGDTIMVYTDGLVEIGASDAQGRRVSVREVLAEAEYGPDYHKRILESALTRSGAKNFSDDVTVVTAHLL
jgi:phosphoserine phosphatase RsbU/P